jgi:hypothetical protein
LGPPDKDKREAEHSNKNTLDNRDCSIRVATRSQNEANKGVRRDSETGVKGVRRARWGGKYTGRFSVRIRYDGEVVRCTRKLPDCCLGNFPELSK